MNSYTMQANMSEEIFEEFLTVPLEPSEELLAEQPEEFPEEVAEANSEDRQEDVLEDRQEEVLGDRQEERPEDRQEERPEDRHEERPEDRQEEHSEDHQEERLEDHQEERLEDRQEEQLEDHQEERLEDHQEERLEYHQEERLEDHQEERLKDHQEEHLEDHQEELSEESSVNLQENLLDVPLLRKAFNIFDSNDDGWLSASELADILRSFDESPASADVRQMVSTYTSDGNGFIHFEDFLIFLNETEYPVQNIENIEDIKVAFDVIDINQKGFITSQELREASGIVGENLGENPIEEMIMVVDSDSDGKVTFADFVKMMQSTIYKM